MKHTESKLQSACIRWARLQYPALRVLLFSIPNGVATSATQARILKAEGLVAGVADTFLAVPTAESAGTFIEFKYENEIWRGGKRTLTRTYQSPEQRAFEAEVKAVGYAYEVVRSFEDFERVVRRVMNTQTAKGTLLSDE